MDTATTSAPLPSYKCHKEVWALKIKEVSKHAHPDPQADDAAFEASPDFQGAFLHFEEHGFAPIPVDAAWYRKHNPCAGGYYVVYADGYASYSPAKAFEEGYAKKEHTLSNALFFNEKRKSMLFRRDRRLDTGHDPYSQEDIVRMYRPYIESFDHDGLEPREIRLLETLISLMA